MERTADAINALNNVPRDAPSTPPTDANFGVVPSRRDEPRRPFQARCTF